MSEKNEYRIQPEDVLKLKTLQSAAFSPDGSQIVYGVSSIDLEKEKEMASLWLYSLDAGETRQLTSGISKDYNPAWSPDGSQIAFLSTREEKPQIYLLPVDGGEAKPITEFEQHIAGGPQWSPDGKMIAFTATTKRSTPPDPDKPYRVDRSVYRFDGVGYLDESVQDIYILSIKDGKIKQLTNDRFSNMHPRWSPDGQEILFLAMMGPDQYNTFDNIIKTVDMMGNMHTLVDSWGRADQAVWLPNGKQILFTGTPSDRPIGSINDVWLINRRGGMPQCRTERLEYPISNSVRSDLPKSWEAIPVISPDSKSAYINVQQGGQVQIYQVALQGEEHWNLLLEGDRTAALFDISSENILFAEANFHLPCDLKLADLDGKKELDITHINQKLLADWKMPEIAHLLYSGIDGVEVEGWLLKPVDGEAPYPTILAIHGGPHSAYGYAYAFDYHMLTHQGFAVLIINHRASTGYGNEFSTAILGDWGNLDYQDLISGVDYCIQKGLVDESRMGCHGVSGGGNLSCWIVGNSDRFKAAVPENPVTNWVSFYGTSDIGIIFSVAELGGHPHEIPEIYRKCSPITYAHNCKTPTLLIQGEHDYRCPAEQSEQFYTVLKANGCIAEMLRLPNSSHGGAFSGGISMRIAHRKALLDWMKRFVFDNNDKKPIN
ncbi:MAG: S9 family peptidase [Anaerolineaceae bacterium]|nr:S9 family peptidase [Anaerolineaceae bacterium]